ncbi:kinase-like domain-containing protein [Linnemannia elongata]|nr:kinase-like domain-containing protein [Linnemannia elongata]
MEDNNIQHINIKPPFPLPPNEAWSSQVTRQDVPFVFHDQFKTDSDNNQFFLDLASGKVIMDAKGQPLAEGTLGGKVHEVVDENNDRFVIKVQKPAAKKIDIAKEVDILSRLRGKSHVVDFQGVFEDIIGYCLIFAIGGPGSLKSMLDNRGALTGPEIVYFGKQMLEGLGNIHKEGITHCNICPENILLGPNMELLLCGFGSAEDSEIQSCARRGTKNFIAPEVLEEKVHTSAIDIFSAGCVFYNFIQGHAPGLTKTTKVTPLPKGFFKKLTTSELGKKFVRRALEFNPNKRASLEELKRHAFLRLGYCPSNIPESAFYSPPTFFSEKKRQQEEQITEESEHTSKRPKKHSTVKPAETSETSQGRHTLRGYSELDEFTALEFEIAVLREETQKSKDEMDEATMKWIEAELKLQQKEHELEEKYLFF